jgi:hypothetical protein
MILANTSAAIEAPSNTERSRLAKVVTNQDTGGLITFAKFAAQEGIDLSIKEEKKRANVLYSAHKAAFYAEGKAWAAYLATSALNVSKVHRTYNADGEIKTARLSFRAPTAAETKKDTKAKKDQALAEAEQALAEKEKQIAALMERLAALESK